jgi:lysophospholipase L1-like esterase
MMKMATSLESASSERQTRLHDGQCLLFIGDSITDCDRRAPPHAPLGWGYVRILADMLCIYEPEKEIRIVNKGIAGNTISHLLSRWSDDVIWQRPDWLFILIGINDLTRFLDRSTSLHCGPDTFPVLYRQLVDETRVRLPDCRITLLEPFFISAGDDIPGSYRGQLIQTLTHYQGTVGEVAAANRLDVVRLQAIFAELLRHRKSDVFSEDKIHPNLTGHFTIADAVYRSLLAEDTHHV